MNVLSLFSGIGGIDIALKEHGGRTVCYVENDPYAAAVLLSRIADGWLDRAPIWPDVRTFDARSWCGRVDCVAGGFPCQPVSVAGKCLAQADARWLWPEFARIVREVRPSLVFVENVPGLLNHGFGDVLGDLAALGYDAQWTVLGADDVGAPHHRKRVWILAHTRCGRPNEIQPIGLSECDSSPDACEGGQDVANADPTGFSVVQGSGQIAEFSRIGTSSGRSRWLPEPDVGRVAHGVPARVDRLRCLGNAVVPKCAAEAFKRLMEVEP